MTAPATTKLATALLAVQKDAPQLQKDALNPHFRNRYVSLHGVLEAVLPVLNKHGLVVMQYPTTLEGKPALRTTLLHAASGEREEDTMLLVLAKDDPQGQGSALTYARRYSLMSMLGLVADEDDDGNRASRAPQRASAPANGDGDKPSEAQLKKLHALRGKLVKAEAFTEEQFQTRLYELYGVTSTKELSRDLISDLIGNLETAEERMGLR